MWEQNMLPRIVDEHTKINITRQTINCRNSLKLWDGALRMQLCKNMAQGMRKAEKNYWFFNESKYSKDLHFQISGWFFYYIKKFISNQGPLHLEDEEDTWKPTRLCQFSEYNCIFWQLHTDLVHGFNKLLGLVHTAKQFKMGQSQYLAISADRGNPLYWSQPIFSELKKKS